MAKKERPLSITNSLYRRYVRHRALTPVEWTRARQLLYGHARVQVEKVAARYNVPFWTVRERVSDVAHELMCKFVARKFSGARNLDAVVATAAWRLAISILRKIKGPLTVSILDKDGERLAPSGYDMGDVDVFGVLRDRLGPFRFPEYTLARDAILVVHLASQSFPGPDYLTAFVPTAHRQVCYNAAVVNINELMEDLRAAARHNGAA